MCIKDLQIKLSLVKTNKQYKALLSELIGCLRTAYVNNGDNQVFFTDLQNLLLIKKMNYNKMGKITTDAINYFIGSTYITKEVEIIPKMKNHELFKIGRKIYTNRTISLFKGNKISNKDLTLLNPIIFLGVVYQYKKEKKLKKRS